MPNYTIQSVKENRPDIISLAFEAAIDAQRWPEVMAWLNEFIDCQTALIVSYDFKEKSGSIRYAGGISPVFRESYADVAPFDPWLGCEAAKRDFGSPCIGKDPPSNQFHHDWLSPQKLHYGMHATLARNGEVGIVCTLLRTRRAGPFNDSDQSNFARVLPHLIRAWGIHERVTASDAKNEALLGILDRLPTGVVLVGRGCEVRELNERAREIVALDDGVWIDRRTLRAESHSETERLHGLVERMVKSEKSAFTAGEDVVALSRPSMLPSFSAMVAPLKGSDEVFGEPLVVVFLSEPHRQNDFDPGRLVRLYGLTPAEAQLTILLVQGLRAEQAANELGVSLNTVRTHLKRIFAKIGANRQADVVRIILSAGIGRPLSGRMDARPVRADRCTLPAGSSGRSQIPSGL